MMRSIFYFIIPFFFVGIGNGFSSTESLAQFERWDEVRSVFGQANRHLFEYLFKEYSALVKFCPHGDQCSETKTAQALLTKLLDPHVSIQTLSLDRGVQSSFDGNPCNARRTLLQNLIFIYLKRKNESSKEFLIKLGLCGGGALAGLAFLHGGGSGGGEKGPGRSKSHIKPQVVFKGNSEGNAHAVSFLKSYTFEFKRPFEQINNICAWTAFFFAHSLYENNPDLSLKRFNSFLKEHYRLSAEGMAQLNQEDLVSDDEFQGGVDQDAQEVLVFQKKEHFNLNEEQINQEDLVSDDEFQGGVDQDAQGVTVFQEKKHFNLNEDQIKEKCFAPHKDCHVFVFDYLLAQGLFKGGEFIRYDIIKKPMDEFFAKREAFLDRQEPQVFIVNSAVWHGGSLDEGALKKYFNSDISSDKTHHWFAVRFSWTEEGNIFVQVRDSLNNSISKDFIDYLVWVLTRDYETLLSEKK